MSEKSGVSGQAIVVPQGGGAIQAIGETFTPDPFTGTGNAVVPLQLPPGRGGFRPELSLSYSTGNGNGPFGLGWELSVPAISRKTEKGVPRYDESAVAAQDTFVLSGQEDLVPVAQPSPDVTRYRPRTEGAFARIERIRPGAADRPDHWQVRSTDGILSRYGSALPSDPPAVVSDPADPGRVFRWLLTESTDPFGNRIEYRYLDDEGQRYLQEIRYADFRDGGQIRFLVTVRLDYAERPDPVVNHRAGFAIRTRLRCTRIETRVHADGDTLVRSYTLFYLDDLVATDERPAADLPLNRASLLARIQVSGHDGPATQDLPPLDFGYTRFDPRQQRFRSLGGTGAVPPRSLADDSFELVSLFGNGLPDVVALDGTAQFWRNLGGRFAPAAQIPEMPGGIRLRDSGVQLADMNGNGRADLLVLDRNGYFPQRFTGGWSGDGFVEYDESPVVLFDDAELRLVDLDGDGVIDALRTDTEFELFLNDPTRGWGRSESRRRGPIEQFPDVSFSDPRVKLADLNGDNLQDWVLVDSGRVDYWPYLGHGRWGARIRMANPPVFGSPGDRFDPRRVLLGDLDGDGLDDIVYIEPNRVTLWINQGGQRWSEPLTITGTPPFPDPDAVRLADLLGTGLQGILWTTDSAAGGDYRFLELSGGVKPHLLATMDNARGAVTRVSYAASTEFLLADDADPRTRWRTPLPFPVHVVASVEATDQISDSALTTRYTYHHGYWDGAEREFRGFGRVEQLDAERPPGADPAGSPPVLTKTWFHVGPTGEESAERREADLSGEYWSGDRPFLARPEQTVELLRALPGAARAEAQRALRGRVLRTEQFALDGSGRQDRPFAVSESQYGLREESAPDRGDRLRRRVFFPHAVASRTTEWERGDDPRHSFTFTGDYDAYGQPGREIALAVPRGRDFRRAGPAGAPYLGTLTATRYAQRDDEDRYIVDRVASRTTHEIVNDGRPPLLDLLAAPRLEPIGQTLTYYDGAPFTGLALGQVGDFGAAVRTESLVLTAPLLRAAYDDGAGTAIPPYLASDPQWTPDYPQPFRDGLPALAGYTFSAGDSGRQRGWFAVTGRRYDVHDDPASGRGLLTATRDPLGRETTIGYDRFGAYPAEVTDPAGLRTRAEHDYRAGQPRLITDPNGNRTAISFTPLGLPASTAVMGRAGESTGDSPQRPSLHFDYDLRAGGPVSVRTVRRVRHTTDPDGSDETIETVEYSDGFGRLVQTRTLADDSIPGDPVFGGGVLPADQDDPATGREIVARPGDPADPNVVVTGLCVYDDKGRVIERYEPFFATGFGYRPPTDAQRGQRVVMDYDARGRVTRTISPDGSEQRVVYGLPADLDDPDQFTPTVWETYTYDANDNAGRTHPAAAAGYAPHWDTPTSIEADALGRIVSQVERTRAAGDPLPPIGLLRTRYRYNVRGNLLEVVDPLGHRAFRYTYDLADRQLRVQSADAGIRRTVLDAAGDPVEQRDSKGALVLRGHDVLQRPNRVWARDGAGDAVTLRERMEYGDGGEPAQPGAERSAARAVNQLGALRRHFDEAGLVEVVRYDFKGNVLDRTRRVISDDVVLSAMDGDAPVDWQPPAGTSLPQHAERLLDPAAYQCSSEYDALNRIVALRYPADVQGRRAELRPTYHRSGALRSVRLDGDPVVRHVAYDAAGRRTLIARGNGLLTRYAYDPQTSELVRLRTERFVAPGPEALRFQPIGPALQDLGYRHDLSGNLLQIVDRTPGSGVRANPAAGHVTDPVLRAQLAAGDALLRSFGYDPLYRLTSATGRECLSNAPTPWADDPRCGFNGGGHATPTQDNAPALTRVYTESYSYDPAGNVLRLRHAAGPAAFVRRFTLVAGTNRVSVVAVGATEFGYSYDQNGNLTAETSSRRLRWDHADRLAAYDVVAAAVPSLQARYLYDGAGRRVKKLTRTQDGALETTVYVDGVFEHRRWRRSGGVAGANNLLHVLDDQRRVALVRVGPAHPDDRGPAAQYPLADHVDSAAVVTDRDGSFVNREEYTPYGETTFGSFAHKRYRFTGAERDGESGLAYHSARYYSPGLARWISPDPAGLNGGTNSYRYANASPLCYVDPGGREPEPDEITDSSGADASASEWFSTAGGQFWARTGEDGAFERADNQVEATLLQSGQAHDYDTLVRGSDEVIEIRGRTETINGNIFSAEDGRFGILLARENTMRSVSSEAYEYAQHWSLQIESMSPEQLDRAFGGVAALGRFLDKVGAVASVITPLRHAATVVDAIEGIRALRRAETPGEIIDALGTGLGPPRIPFLPRVLGRLGRRERKLEKELTRALKKYEPRPVRPTDPRPPDPPALIDAPEPWTPPSGGGPYRMPKWEPPHR